MPDMPTDGSAREGPADQGRLAAAISTAIVQVFSEHTGRGPTRARTTPDAETVVPDGPRCGRGAQSVEGAGGQNVARGGARLGPAAGVKKRAVQAATVRRRDSHLGCPAVVDDPGHDRSRVGALRDDRRPLDDAAAGTMRSRKPSDERSDRLVVHVASVAWIARSTPRRCRPGERLSWLQETLGDHLFLLRVAPHPQKRRKAVHMRPTPTTRADSFADFRFSEQALADLLDALRARARSHPDNPGLIACWPAVREHRMAGACNELLRRGHLVRRVSIVGWESGKARDGWALGA
jgi:hypothetical protein